MKIRLMPARRLQALPRSSIRQKHDPYYQGPWQAIVGTQLAFSSDLF